MSTESNPPFPAAPESPDGRLQVSEEQIQAAMRHYEQLNGKGDGVAICREVAKLAELLGSMWFAKEQQASVQASSAIGQLLLQSNVLAASPLRPLPIAL